MPAHPKTEISRKQWEDRIWGSQGPLYRILAAPTSVLYSALARTRAKLYKAGILPSYRSDAIVVSVGNLTPGGSGKTPIVIALAEAFIEEALKPVVITRGYGGDSRAKAIFVDPGSDPASVGDEPVMMAAMIPAPVIKAPQRKHGAKLAEVALKPDIVLLDDAFGHLAIQRDFDIVVVDASRGFGNGKVMPAGPLREPLSELARADCVVITGSGDSPSSQTENIKATIKKFSPAAEVLEATYKVTGLVKNAGGNPEPVDTLQGRKIVAFSGIGNPLSFRLLLEKHGARVAKNIDFIDHHPYTDFELERIARAVADSGSDCAVTTEKDLARLGDRRPPGVEVIAPGIKMEVKRLKWLTDRILGKN